jgi:hypothetical protein
VVAERTSRDRGITRPVLLQREEINLSLAFVWRRVAEKERNSDNFSTIQKIE